MKNAIILHGQPGKKEYYDPRMPSMSNAHWIPWLQGQLLKNDIAAATPEVPFAFKPEWNIWKQEVERFEIGPDTLIIGHSRGADFWLRWLSENKNATVGKVVLIAPSIGYLTKKRKSFRALYNRLEFRQKNTRSCSVLLRQRCCSYPKICR